MNRRFPWIVLVVVWSGSCLQWELTCSACGPDLDSVDSIDSDRPKIPYEWVDPCTLHYHDEPNAPGYPVVHVNGISDIGHDTDREHRLIRFPYCSPDAGMRETVNVYWYYDTHVEH